jgi:hypothetical protein
MILDFLKRRFGDIREALRKPVSDEDWEKRDRIRAKAVAARRGNILEPEDVQAEWARIGWRVRVRGVPKEEKR